MVIKPVNIQRQSNMELLRIVAMLAVIAVHLDGASLGLPSPQANISLLSRDDWWRLAMEAVTIVGVNCFTLISGYFGIRTYILRDLQSSLFGAWCIPLAFVLLLCLFGHIPGQMCVLLASGLSRG